MVSMLSGNRDRKWKKYANKLGIKYVVWKHVENTAQGCYKMEMTSKPFAIPILTASSLKLTI